VSELKIARVAPLLLASGFCSLIYQVSWLREFRLVFGASTAASAAVLAIFIGGLGVGGLVLGKRADRAASPLMMYGNLELVIAATAALSPLLFVAIRHLYVGAGGTFALGITGGTVLRLVLASLVLGVPTLAMGGTLAAVTRAVSVDADARRRGLAVLYGVNTLGAVLGALASTFVLLEILGTRRTIWTAALLNALVALIARNIARKASAPQPSVEASRDDDTAQPSSLPRWFVLVAAGVVGFAFFLMEITWYRMLGPILGGSVFTFGLILAVALLGIGVGGLAYALRPQTRASTVHGLVLVCAIEAIGLALPLALGDRVAFAASALRTTSVFGFAGQVAGWAAIACLVILPAAIASGIQFPLLVNLVGRGTRGVGHQLGLVYVTNTIGAIVGSLVGGFILLPQLGAVGCWRLATALLVALAIAALVLGMREITRRQLVTSALTFVLALWFVSASGPTAAWRHGGIGAGRSKLLAKPTDAAELVTDANRRLIWEAEGVESSVALAGGNGMSFVVNGKTDGNVQSDAATQMMGGLVGALIHPAPKRAMVIGLGTGETAGWLADSPGVERVDVIELEPAILDIARWAAPANRNVMEHPKVHVAIGDAREALLVSDDSYDIVFSEPSNPYRAGVSSLYTREFYEAVRDRIGERGLFLQWTQSYEVDGQTIATIYSTLGAVFDEVHTFRLLPGDLLFVASRSPIRYDTARIGERVRSPVVHDALAYAWGVTGVEGFLSHFLGDNRLAVELTRRAGGDLNTDDKTLIEFAFARSLGLSSLQNEPPLRQIAAALEADRPPVDGPVDWGLFDELRLYADALSSVPLMLTPNVTAERRARAQARGSYVTGALPAVAAAWKQQPALPTTRPDAVMVAEALAAQGELLQSDFLRPAEAALFRGRALVAREQWEAAAYELVLGFSLLRADVFVSPAVVERALRVASTVAERDPRQARRLLGALALPFALFVRDDARLFAQLGIAAKLDAATVVDVLAPIEPHVPWRLDVLLLRRKAYAETRHPRLSDAEADVDAFYAGEPSAVAPP
jgi:spermidine synthase